MKEYIVFSDGSSRGNPGPGGFGAVVVYDDSVFELGGGEAKTTNNRMELTGVIEGLSFLQEKKGEGEVLVYTDSSYVVNGITKWIYGWQANGWKKQDGEKVLNEELWKKLLHFSKLFDVSWKLLPGHSGIVGNERCDEIATSFADKKKIELYAGSLGEYPFKILPVSFSETQKKVSKTGKAFSYVSSVSGVVKVHKSWKECEDRVRGQKGARYRKVFSPAEEKALIDEFNS